MKKEKQYRVVKVYDENQLEDTLNSVIEEGYDVHQIFLRSYFIPASKQRGLYYSIIFKRVNG